MSELRQNFFRKEWGIIASDCAGRPIAGCGVHPPGRQTADFAPAMALMGQIGKRLPTFVARFVEVTGAGAK